MPDFVHLHCHTQYSLLDGASDIRAMMEKAANDGQQGVALTDHGNMFGAFKFVAEANKKGLKPVVGCEFYLVEDRHKKAFSRAKGEQDVRYHQLLLAKNKQGYENLSKLCSLGFIEGAYGKFPRIDKELILQYHEGLIATSCCIGAEIPQAILQGKLDLAEERLRWWIELLGEDFYIELQRHRNMENIDGLGVSQEDVNQQLLRFAEKYNVKVIATNDSHYIDEEDAAPHDILLCINTSSLLEENDRFRFPSSDFYFKTKAEMNRLFADVPQGLDNTLEILGKIEKLDLQRDVLLPAFPLPAGFDTQEDYLRFLSYEGAKRRYGAILPPNVVERIDFELDVIIKSGYSGYFLIVQDFTTTARQMGVSVGPGRGSAAGSAVAYCLGITNVDPIKYDLLFERFLNPERVSMPDIDIDFDDVGREKVINYVVDKYGRNQVAQIVTYGTMAAKLSLRDVGRVMNIPLSEVDKVAKSFPNHLEASLKKVLAKNDIDAGLKEKLQSEEVERAYQFRKLADGKDDIGHMIQTAKKLEGSVRNTGIHACGVVITPGDITRYVPVTTAKDSDLLVTQFDNSVAESAGLLKMDFLGLKTLTIIKDAVNMIREAHGIDIDPDDIPLDDVKTYELFQHGDTIGIFQYESAGMQKHLKDLAPTKFEDLIAMNALYRPGPLQYIPKFIARKHGREPIAYDLPAMEEYLAETYGITVYQEQVMLLSQKLANFSKGQADALRKGMGKKKKEIIDALYPKFIEGGTANGHPKDVLDKVWGDWEAFAAYAFNKSHSTCYALVAFQTAYLKAHYPAEFMASVLTHNKGDIAKVTFFLKECKRMGLDVLGPNVNESASDFSVNKKGQVRFGLSALKGVGEGPVDEIIRERNANGPFESVYDMLRRIPNTGAINKKVMESLVLGGGLDGFEDINRTQYFAPSDKYDTFLEHLLKYGQAYHSQQAEALTSLFGEDNGAMIPEPQPPVCEPWPLMEKLNREKEVAGIYISGHPLDDFRAEIEAHTNCSLDEIENYGGKELRIAGIVMKAQHRISKKGTGYGQFTIQDFTGSVEFPLFSEDYQKFKSLLEEGQCVFIRGAYQQRAYSDEMQLRINELSLLETVSKKMTQSVTLQIPIEAISEEMIEQMDALCLRHKGPHKLRVVVYDRGAQLSLALASKARKVHADNEFIQEIEKLGLACKLN